MSLLGFSFRAHLCSFGRLSDGSVVRLVAILLGLAWLRLLRSMPFILVTISQLVDVGLMIVVGYFGPVVLVVIAATPS